MKKTISIFLAVLLAVLFAGCGGPANNGGTNLLPAGDDPVSEETANAPADNGSPGSAGTVADSYSAYLEAKGIVVGKLSDGLSSNPDEGFAVFSFLGVSMVDMMMLPVSFFGMGQQAVEMGMAMMGASGVQYSESGNSYTVTYKDEDGQTLVFTGTYNPSSDALTTTATLDGTETIYSEYRKTSFGYIGQYYFYNEDGTTNLYQIAVQGEDGTIGISLNTPKPSALLGSEAADFPKGCTEWYSISGTTITGVTSDGTELNFEYTPSETEE